MASQNPRILEQPKPKTWFREFGDSSLNFILLCWISHAEVKFDVTSEVNYAIDKAFRENDIEIPFPQRDLHLRSAEGAVSLRRVSDG